MWPRPWKKLESSLPIQVDFLNLCEQNVRSIEDLASRENLLNQRQCQDLSCKLSKTTLNIRELVIHCRAFADLFRPALENQYRYLEKAKGLVSKCGEDDWCAAAVFQSQNENAFREILLEVGLCYNALYEQARSASEDGNVHPEDLRQTSVFGPATDSDVMEDQQDLQKRLEDLANEPRSAKLLDHILPDLEALKQCLAKYLLVKLNFTADQSEVRTLDTGSEILWRKENEPSGTWGSFSRFLGAGAGASGVCKAQWLGIPCAKKEFHPQEAESVFLKEAGILAYLKHPRIVNFYCCGNGEQRGDRFIAMELMEMSLFDLIEEQKAGYYSVPVVVDMMVQMARGMCYLHDRGVAHRDLKPQNVVVNRLKSPHLEDFFCLKLVDFGMSKTKVEVSKFNTMSALGIGTTRYRAPEVHPKAHPDGKGKAVWFRADVFSYAMTCAHLLSLRAPFGEMQSLSELYEVVKKGRRPELSSDCPQELVAVLKDCWNTNPRSRPTFIEVCTRLEIFRHKFVRGCSILGQVLEDDKTDVSGGIDFIKVKLKEQSSVVRLLVDYNVDELQGEFNRNEVVSIIPCVCGRSLELLPQPSSDGCFCNICCEKIDGEVFRCETCDYDVHPDCAEIKDKVEGEFNRNEVVSIIPCVCGRPLELLPRSPYVSGNLVCNLCWERGDEEVYHCEFCKFDAHPDCAEIQDEVAVFFHDHPLHLLVRNYYNENPNAICRFCEESMQHSEWVYRCEQCDFDVHALCTKYPRGRIGTVHRHLVTLIQCPPRKRFSCICCNGKVRGNTWRYTCTMNRCSFDMHPFCAILPRKPLCIFDRSHRLSLFNDQRGFHCGKCGSLGFSRFYHCDHCDVDIHLDCLGDVEVERDERKEAYMKFMLEYGTRDNHAKVDMIAQLVDKLLPSNASETSSSSTSRLPPVTLRVLPTIQRLTPLGKPGLDAFDDVNLCKKIDAETLERKAKKMAAKEARQKLKANSLGMLENLERIVLEMQSSKSMSEADGEVFAATHKKLKKGKYIVQEEIASQVQSKMRQGPRISLFYLWHEGGSYELLTSLRADKKDVRQMLLCEEPGHEHVVQGCHVTVSYGELGEQRLGKLQPLLSSGLQVVTRAMSTLAGQVPQLDWVTLPDLGDKRWDLRAIDLGKHGKRSREASEDEENVNALKRAENCSAEWILSDFETRGINIYESRCLRRVRYIVTKEGDCPGYTRGTLAWLCNDHLKGGLEAGRLVPYPVKYYCEQR